MSEKRGRRSGGGRSGKRAARQISQTKQASYIERNIPYFEVLDESGLAQIEYNADTVLEEIGIEFRDDTEALQILKDAGADVKGELVRFPRGMCRQIIQATAPKEFTQHARNPSHRPCFVSLIPRRRTQKECAKRGGALSCGGPRRSCLLCRLCSPPGGAGPTQ